MSFLLKIYTVAVKKTAAWLKRINADSRISFKFRGLSNNSLQEFIYVVKRYGFID